MAVNPQLLGIVAGAEVQPVVSGTPFPDDTGDVYDGRDGPDYVKDEWFSAVLNGMQVPGKTTVKCTPKKKLKTPKATGKDGGPTTDLGHEPARLDITIEVWMPSQWALLQTVLGAIWRAPGAPVSSPEVKAVTIVHPACSGKPWYVSSMLIETLETPEVTDEGMRIRIKAVQFIEPKKTDVARRAKGAGPVPLAKEFGQAKKNEAPANPKTTDAVPRLPAAPRRGTAEP
jgi:hypothetical protein